MSQQSVSVNGVRVATCPGCPMHAGKACIVLISISKKGH